MMNAMLLGGSCGTPLHVPVLAFNCGASSPCLSSLIAAFVNPVAQTFAGVGKSDAHVTGLQWHRLILWRPMSMSC